MTDFTKLQPITTEYFALGQSKNQLLVWARKGNQIFYSYDGENWNYTGVVIEEWTADNEIVFAEPVSQEEIAVGIKNGVSYALYRIGLNLKSKTYFQGRYNYYNYNVMAVSDEFIFCVYAGNDKVSYRRYNYGDGTNYAQFYERESSYSASTKSKVFASKFLYVSLWDGATQSNKNCTLLIYDKHTLGLIDTMYTTGFARAVIQFDENIDIDLFVCTVLTGSGNYSYYDVYVSAVTPIPSRSWDGEQGKICEIESLANHQVAVNIKYIDNVYHEAGFWINVKSNIVDPSGYRNSHTVYLKPRFRFYEVPVIEEPSIFSSYKSLSNAIDIGAGQLIVLKGNGKVAYTEEAGTAWSESNASENILMLDDSIFIPNGNILQKFGYNLIRMNVKNSGVKFMDVNGEIRQCRAFLLDNPDKIRLKRVHVINAQGEHVILYDNKLPQPDRKCLCYFNGEKIRYIYSI